MFVILFLWKQEPPSRCPHCRREVDVAGESVHRLACDLRPVRCDNFLVGCPGVFPAGRAASHRRTECRFELFPCGNRGCPYARRSCLFRSALAVHDGACGFAQVRCARCAARMPRRDLSRHLEGECHPAGAHRGS